MHDVPFYLTMAAAGLLAIAILAHAALRGWSGWLDLKRTELDRRASAQPSAAATRIEVADIRERLRKLEAIAAGVEL